MFGYGGTRTARDAFCFQTEQIQLDPTSRRTPLFLSFSLLPSHSHFYALPGRRIDWRGERVCVCVCETQLIGRVN